MLFFCLGKMSTRVLLHCAFTTMAILYSAFKSVAIIYSPVCATAFLMHQQTYHCSKNLSALHIKFDFSANSILL